MNSHLYLPQLGWRGFFQQQLSPVDVTAASPARIINYERSAFTVLCNGKKVALDLQRSFPPMTVGDWVLLDGNGRFVRLLERFSVFERTSDGGKAGAQLIAANVDTVFIVCSLNLDFNLSRIERYLALASEAKVEPVLVLTKLDRCDNLDDYLAQTKTLNDELAVIAINALDAASVGQLEPWCDEGRTVVLLGSSGVGKSTLLNTLMTDNVQRTGAIREEDSKGRHTTTSRSLHTLPGGGLLLDTPGIRELQLTSADHSLADAFADVTDVAIHCKFADCQHKNEPGCAVLAAIANGTLDARRLANFHKLLSEQAAHEVVLNDKRALANRSSRLKRSEKIEQDRKRTE